MDLTKNDAAVCPDSIDAQASTKSAGEIDLYDELITFAELSPQEQSRVVDRPKKAPAQPEEESATQAQEQRTPEPVLSLPVEADAVVQEAGTPIELVTEEQISAGENRPNVSLEAIQSEFAIGKLSLPSTVADDRPFELVLTEELIETKEPQGVPSTPVAFADLAEDGAATELVAAHSPPESVDAVTTAPAEEPARVSEILKPTVETDIRIPPSAAAPRPSGPLSGFNLPPEIVYTGALSRGVCLACGAESGTDDLFCLTCGVFIDEIASSLPSSPTCGECTQRIDADEIFCPWCGSSVTE